MPGRDERVVGEDELPVPPDDVLLGVQLVAQALDALAADENQLGLARGPAAGRRTASAPSRISGGIAAPHRPQNLCPMGTGVEHDLQT